MEILRSFNIGDINVRKGEDERVREFIISTARRDSHGTIIPIEKWDFADYNKAGGFYYQHDTQELDNHLGIGTARIEGNTLVGVGTFETADVNPKAERILKKVDFGSLKCTSVGFLSKGGHWGIERNGEDPETYYFDGQVLKEWSIVHIPSNPDAIKKAWEPMDNFMLKVLQDHKSKGFQMDYKRGLTKLKGMDLLINFK